ncbi:MAG TPA: cytochrome P450 [Phototrophicaceae bacterium]|jgi:cytochrome P450 PksS|nr:cytochrome P450 [Phototrophicaceae bacterium]
MNKIPTVNLLSPEFKANPYPFYAQLRAEAPVHRTTLPNKQPVWLITRYDDVMMVLKDDQRFVKNLDNARPVEQKAKSSWMIPVFNPLGHNMLDTDWDDHSRLRDLVHKAFTPSLVAQMRDRVQTLADELLDQAERKGQMDVIQDYALPITLTVISEILGVSAADQAQFQRWSRSFLSPGSLPGLLLSIPSFIMMSRFLRRTFKERRTDPHEDLITALVQAEAAGDKLNEDELLSLVFLLLIAGHETTVNLIGSGTLALLENPDQLALLRQQPDLIKNATEELLRYVSPVEQATERYAREDVTLHNVTIPKGELVLAVVASANRDEGQFDHPDQLDITRKIVKHAAFGQGVHYCVGAPLARMEGQIALQTLVNRMPDLKLKVAPEKLRWRPTPTVRGLEALPVLLS